MTTGSRVRSVRLPADVEARLRVVADRFGWSMSAALVRVLSRGLPDFEGELVEIGGVQVVTIPLGQVPTGGIGPEHGSVTMPASALGGTFKPAPKKATVTELRALVTETEQRMAPVNGAVKKHRLTHPASSNCRDCDAPRGLRSKEEFETMNCQEKP